MLTCPAEIRFGVDLNELSKPSLAKVLKGDILGYQIGRAPKLNGDGKFFCLVLPETDAVMRIPTTHLPSSHIYFTLTLRFSMRTGQLPTD